MKIRSITPVIFLIIIFALLGIGTGCSESDSSSIKEIMKDIPAGVSSFEYCDLKAMRGDYDLEDLYNNVKDGYLAESVLYNIDFGDINYLANCGNKELVIFRGKFGLDNIRDALQDNNYIAVGFREEEAWLNSTDTTMVALLNDSVAIGDKVNVEEYIRVIEGEADSLLDNDDARNVIDKLTHGIASVYISNGIGFNTEAFGTAYKKKDENTMSISNVFKFGNADKAEQAKDGIKELFTATTDYENVNVERDGEFIILTGQLDIADMVQL